MKKLSIILMCVATLAFTACGSLKGGSTATTGTTNTTAAKACGKSTASALITLYNSYRAAGTINLGNANDLTAALVVATGYTNMRANQADPAYKKAFAAGMISAGAGLITSANVDGIINTMNSLTGLNVNAANISNSVGTATAIIQLLQALGTTQQ